MVSVTQRVSKRLENARKQAQKDVQYCPSDSDSDEEELEGIGQPLNKAAFLQRILSPEDSSTGGAGDDRSDSSTSRRSARKSGPSLKNGKKRASSTSQNQKSSTTQPKSKRAKPFRTHFHAEKMNFWRFRDILRMQLKKEQDLAFTYPEFQGLGRQQLYMKLSDRYKRNPLKGDVKPILFSQELSDFQFVEINGMKVTEPTYAYVLLWKALSGQKATANHALQLLEKQFSAPGPKRPPCVVLMDELDLLVTAKQTVMYNFFEWPSWLHSRLIVVAVANTMDLPERMLSNKISSRLGLTRINFQPYTYQQLVKIVESRLKDIKAFRKEAIEFAARKVGAVSGDARRALDICRRAVEIVETNTQKSEEQRQRSALRNPTEDLGPAPELEQVTIRIVDQAIKEMFASPNVRLIQTASLHQKMFLVALTSRLRRLGLAEVEFSEIAHTHLQLCRLHNIEPPMLSDLSTICASLGSSRCLLVESGKQDIRQRVRLSVSEEDVIMALKADPLFKRLLEI
ncbi:Origin recognition complex, subunit 1 [Mortierella sp. GBA43]|nr:Origin recognition complex, subunit 1 [Mortierella sp. GBA43]